MVFNLTQMKMAHLSQISPNVSSIWEVYNRFGKTFLTSLVGSHRATGGLWVYSPSVKEGLIIFPLFLLERMQYCQWHLRRTVREGGPMRGLELIMWSQGQWQALKKLHPNIQTDVQKDRWTWQIYDWIGPLRPIQWIEANNETLYKILLQWYK